MPDDLDILLAQVPKAGATPPAGQGDALDALLATVPASQPSGGNSVVAQVWETANTHAIKSLGGATFTDLYENAVASAKRIGEKVLGEPSARTARNIPALPTLEHWLRGIPEAIDFLHTPLGAATVGVGHMFAGAGRAAVGAGLTASMYPAARLSVEKYAEEPTPENLGDVAKYATLMGIPTAAVKLARTAKGLDGLIERHNARAAKLIETERTTGLGKEMAEAIVPESVPVVIRGRNARIEPIGATRQGRPQYAVVDAETGRPIASGNGQAIQQFLRSNEAKPPEAVAPTPGMPGAPPPVVEAVKPATVAPGSTYALQSGQYTVTEAVKGRVRFTREDAAGQKTAGTMPMDTFTNLVKAAEGRSAMPVAEAVVPPAAQEPQEPPAGVAPVVAALESAAAPAVPPDALDQVLAELPVADSEATLKPATSEQVAAPEVVARATTAEVRLPRDLAGARPRYNYGGKAFELEFASDVDRAAYITAQKVLSKRDADFVTFVGRATGLSEMDVRAHGARVRDAIKTQAKDAEPGKLKIAALVSPAAPTAPAKSTPAATTQPAAAPLRALAETAARRADAAAERRAQPAPPPPDEFSQEAGPTLEEVPQAPTEVAKPEVPEDSTIQPGAKYARREGQGDTGPRAEVLGPREPVGPIAEGNETKILIPGDTQTYKARYVVRELDDVASSHLGETFQPNPRYQIKNERNYADRANQERVVLNSLPERFAPEWLITDNPDVTNGPPAIDPQGNTMGGNSRVMILERVRAFAPKAAEGYKRMLVEKAAQYGVDPALVAKMKNPILVRELPEETLATIEGGRASVVRATQKTGTAELTPAERATSDARGMTEDLADYLGAVIEDTGPSATLADALTGRRGFEVVQRLTDAGLFTVQEKPRLIDSKTGAVTADAKQRIGKMLLGQFFRDSDQMTRTTASIRNKLERVAAPLMRVQGKEGWDLMPEVREAIDLLEYASARGLKDLRSEVFTNQTSMFEEQPQYSERVVTLAEVLRDNGPVQLVKMVRGYSAAREGSLFEEAKSAGQAFVDVFGGEWKPGKVGERGSLTIPNPFHRDIVKQGEVYSPRPGLYRAVLDVMKAVETRVAQEGHGGKELEVVTTQAKDIGEVRAGQRISKLYAAGLMNLDKPDRQNLLDVLQGVAEPNNEKVEAVFYATRGVTDELGADATAARVLVKEKRTIRPGEAIPPTAKLTQRQKERIEDNKRIFLTYRREFRPRRDFFPHIIASVENLRKGPIRDDVIDNLVRQGVRNTPEDAAAYLDAYRKWIETGGRMKELEQHLIESGQARDPAEAYRLLSFFRKRHIKRQGSLEYARQVDLPFYDPNPIRVLPPLVHSSSLRLAQIREFGQDNQRINELVKKIEEFPNALNIRHTVDRLLGMIDEPDTSAAKVARFFRVVQGFKLGLAFIPNATQGALNSLLAGDLYSAIYGGKMAFTGKGRRFAMESGASIEGVISEMTRYAGAEWQPLTAFLKATGFTATERNNRVWAANAGFMYATRMLDRLKRNPNDGRARHVLADRMRLDVDRLLKLGRLDGDAALMAAKRFSDYTQFRSDIKDLPEFATSAWGKVLFQFKNYIYGQSRLIHEEVTKELLPKKLGGYGRPGRGGHALLILAIAFPLAGEAIADIRNLAKRALGGKAKPRPTGALARYFDNIAQAGTLGMYTSAWESGKYGRATEGIAGPTIGEVGQLIDNAARNNAPRNLTKQAFRRIPVFGSALVDQVFPPKRPLPPELR